MENRRQHYRHTFGPNHRLQVKLSTIDNSTKIDGEVLNLSLGGMCVHANALQTAESKKWVADIDDGDSGFALRIPVEPIYINEAREHALGFRFLYPAYITKREEIEKKLWQFLLEEQRLERRQQQEAQDNESENRRA